MRHTECMRHTQSRTVRVPFKVCVRAREPGMEPGTLRPCHGAGSSCYDPVATHVQACTSNSVPIRSRNTSVAKSVCPCTVRAPVPPF